MLKKYFSAYMISYIILLSFIVMFFEAFSISLIVPLLTTFLNGSNDYFITKIYFEYFSSFSSFSDTFIICFLLFVFFFIKLIFLVYALFVQTSFYVKFKVLLSENIFKGYLKMPFTEHIKINSALILRNTINETESVAGILKQITLIITETLVLIGISTVLILYQPFGSAVIIFYISITSYIFYMIFKQKLLKWGNLRQFHEGKRIQKINEGIKSVIEVKTSESFNFFFKSFTRHNNLSNEVHKKRTVVANLPKIWLEFVLLFALITLSIILFYSNQDFKYIIPNF